MSSQTGTISSHQSLISTLATSFNESRSFPSAFMIYQASLILYEEPSLDPASFDDILQSLPIAYLRELLKDINTAYISSTKEENNTKAICGLYQSSILACEIGCDSRIVASLVDSYDNMYQDSSSGLKEGILRALSKLLLHGVIPSINIEEDVDLNEDNEESSASLLHAVTNTIQEFSPNHSTCLGDLQQFEKQQNLCPSVSQSIANLFHDEAERRYVSEILAALPTTTTISSSREEEPFHVVKTVKEEAPSAAVSPRQILINQVRDILPHLGEGYVETALACYSNDPEQTISALLDASHNSSNVHPRLRHLDPKLPARKKESPDSYVTNDPLAKEDIQRQKRLVKEMERQEEDEAYKLSQSTIVREYNDDYDDQYDGIGDDGGACGVAANDKGLYDVADDEEEDDYETIMAYNKWAKGVEGERQFWEENRNTNRNYSSKSKVTVADADADDNDGENEIADKADDNVTNARGKQWGPDKGKGGRIIGPDGKYLPFTKGKKNKKKQQQQQQQQQQQPNQKIASSTSSNSKMAATKKMTSGGKGGPKNKKSDKKDGDNNTNDNNNNMSKIQKRRKNDNKSKIGNHHRKDRALKKTGGM